MRSVLGALFGVLLLLLLAGVSLSEAIRVLIVCTLQVSSGAFFVSKVWYRRRLKLEESIGLGFVVGATFSVVSEQVFLKTIISPIGWAIPIFIAAVYYFVSKNRSSSDTSDESVEDSKNLVWLGIGVLAILGPEWYWPAIPAVLFAVAQLLTISQVTQHLFLRFKKILVSSLRVLAVVMLGFGVYIRPSSWWIEDSDFGFFEALTVSFSNWGVTGNSLAVGSSIKYHWFVYAWVGGVTKAAQLPSWVMLSRAGIVIGVVAVVCLAWIAISYFCRSHVSRVLALLLFCFFDSYPSWGSGFRIGLVSSPSQLIGFAWLLAIFVLIIEQQNQKVKYSPLLFSVLFTGAMLSKISHGVVGLAGLMFLVAIQLISKRKLTLQRLLDVGASMATVITLFFAFYYGANNASISPLKFPAAIQGELSVFSGIQLVVSAIILLIGFVGFHLFSVASACFNNELRSDPVFIFIVGAGLAGLFLTLIVESFFGSQIYFLHSASVLLLVFAASLTANLSSNIRRLSKSNFMFCFLSIVGFFAAIISFSIPSLNSGSIPAIILRLSKSLVILIPISVAILFALRQEKAKKLVALLSFGAIGIANMSVGFSGVNWFSTLRREFSSYERNSEVNLGTSQLIIAMSWFRESSNSDDIFVSNNESFLLSALSHRRGFLQAEYLVRRHTVFTAEWESELDRRGELLTELFLDPNKSKLQQIADRGVRWLIVEKSKIAPEELLFFREPNFENNEYLILDLDLLT